MEKLRDILKMQNNTDATAQGPLVFHTFYAEFRGDTPEDLVAALHRDAEAGTDLDYQQWWAWQKKLWSYTRGYTVPAPDEPNACAKLINILVDVGALERGPRPASLVIPDRRPT